jgi:hypothetical protein
MKPSIQYLIDHTGNKTSVLVSYDFWEELIENYRRQKKKSGISNEEKTVQDKGNKTQKTRNGFGSLGGDVWMADDFNEPIDDFKGYM